MIVDLDDWRTRMTLEALQKLDEQWTAILKAAAARGDDDTAADYSNDLALLHTLREGFEAKAVEAFGLQIKHFSREPYTVPAVPKNGEPVHPR